MTGAGRIVVPLDATDLSLSALPAARALARALAKPVTLLAVWDTTDQALEGILTGYGPSEIRQAALDAHRAHLEQARALLDQVDAVQIEVREGDPAGEIVTAVTQGDVIVMATHARGGLGRFFLGSVADRVSRHSPVPVLLVHPSAESQQEEFLPRTIEVPLDGSERAEGALPVASQLAVAFGARLILVRAVPRGNWAAPVVVMPPDCLDAVEREAEREALAYLQEVAAKHPGAGTNVVRGHPYEALAESPATNGVDLVVMTSHGRGGLRRWALGSVAAHLLRTLHQPILLVPARSDQQD